MSIKLKSLDEFLQESSLSRVWQHFKSDKTVVIMTAFRGDKSYQENISNNKKIANIFKSEKFEYFFVDGYWIENKGTDDEQKVSEDSIFIISEPERSDELIKLAFNEAKKFNQDAIFVKTKDEVYLYFKDGTKDKLTGGLQPGKIGDFYTQLRNNKKSNTFVFESARENYGFFGNLAVHLFEEKYHYTVQGKNHGKIVHIDNLNDDEYSQYMADNEEKLVNKFSQIIVTRNDGKRITYDSVGKKLIINKKENI